MSNELISKIRHSVMGERQLIDTGFGPKPLIYADYTASGRSLTFIEDFIADEVLPFYANTHTESSFTGAHTSSLREQSREIIHSAINGNDEDQLIFCGSGATTAINKLIDILNLRLPSELNERYKLLAAIPKSDRPVVFIGAYEHHSNELPWRESIADVIVIPLTETGQLNMNILENALLLYADRTLKLGSFSAASNVTGIKTDVDAVSELLHKHDAISLWDYAAAAPYVGIDMNPDSITGDASKDAAFISPHKFIGGPGTPGILAVKKSLLKNRVPAVPGGGTVSYVSPDSHRFISDHQRREEGGTPAIVESIRAGLVFKLQQEVGTDLISSKEDCFRERAIARWNEVENIKILGNTDAKSLSIFSLRITHQGKDLHYGFIVALLNDLFGIQGRGGCSCAGPYGHGLLGINRQRSEALENEIDKGQMILRPGWVRLNFNYFIDEETFEYLLSAIELIAQYGWKLLPYYCFDEETATWRYQNLKQNVAIDLNSFRFETLGAREHSTDKSAETCLSNYTELASQELQRHRISKRFNLNLNSSAEKLRWFVLPQEITLTQALDMAS